MTWTSFLQSPPSNLNLITKVLPTGQLAEAQITRYVFQIGFANHSQGRPFAGTILIDDDANGTGWF